MTNDGRWEGVEAEGIDMARRWMCGLLVVGGLWAGSPVFAQETLIPEAKPAAADGEARKVIGPMSVEAAREKTFAWLAERGVKVYPPAPELLAIWQSLPQPAEAEQVLDAVVASVALADQETRDFLAACLRHPAPLEPPSLPVGVTGGSGFISANVKLYFGRYLVGRNMVEEASDLLAGTPLTDVVDPATLLFLRAVCHHQLLEKEPGLKTIETLLKRTAPVPVRYSAVAELMKYDLEALSPDSLDEVARKMSDVERRLQLGRSGQKTQKKEEEIVEGLDKIIKKLEQQAQGSSSSSGGSGGGSQPNSPASDSTVKGSTAPGEVDKKVFSKNGAWGLLPDKQRAKAKELITREFPAHYRQAIEEYTRKAAARTAGK